MASNSQPLEYLEGLSGITFQKLYQEPATALSIFRRMLPRLAQSIVMAMLFVDQPFLEPDLRAWFRPEYRNNRMRAITALEKLHIMSKMKTAENVLGYQLSPSFAKSLREALTGSSSGNPFGVFYDPLGGKVDIPFLDNVARTQWEGILYYIVGSVDESRKHGGGRLIGKAIKQLLEAGDFVKPGYEGSEITKAGFSFLLQETNSQIWTLLLVYLERCESGEGGDGSMESVDVLNFLFKLGSFQLGQAYSTNDLTPTQRKILHQLSDFGLVYRRDESAAFFYPTRLATTLASDAPALVTASDLTTQAQATNSVMAHDQPTSNSYIVVETNYRLYAYVSSPLQICILALFVKLLTRFPNMVSGKITKRSIGRAFERGIGADQIITFLRRHAHPQMKKFPLILPPTVTDQIKLWQIEGDQIVATPGFLLNQFSSAKEYEEVKKYAQSLGVLIWSSDEKTAFFVSQLDQLRAYLANRQLRQQQQLLQQHSGGGDGGALPSPNTPS